jgi:L-alanine-DL-glutamate epimerase-like enolase superfamily enzyme
MTLEVSVEHESWPLREPFEIAREVMHHVPLIAVTVRDGAGHVGRGEAAGIDYDGETPQSMATQIDAVSARLHDAIDGPTLAALMPAGGARNALDCALWDLRAKQSGVPAWQAAGLAPLRPCLTAFTLGLGTADETQARARAARGLPLIKLKVDAVRHVDVVRGVRDTLPDARLIVDANQAWTLALLEQLLPDLQREGVELIEQPLSRGSDAMLDGLRPPIPLAADESCTDRGSLAVLRGRYQAINIKLDKCGGLTEAMALAHAARDQGFEIMVGNMCGSSLAMAPAFLVAQLARWVDLDGPLLQHGDRAHAMRYESGIVHPPSPQLWG